MTYCPVSQRERKRASEREGESERERAKEREGERIYSVRRYDNSCRAAARATAPSCPLSWDALGRDRGEDGGECRGKKG